MNKQGKVYLAGHTGLVGSALMRRLKSGGYANIVTRTHRELDLTRQADVEEFFQKEKPDYVFLAAAKVGGIYANNTYKADFIYQNIMIAANVINASYKYGVQKLLNLGSSCIYPRDAAQPLKEEYLLTGPLEATNDAYALAKIAAVKLCRHYNEQYGTDFISVMPTNLYGPEDNFDLETSHVLPALIRRISEAKQQNQDKVVIWGTGAPRREFMHCDDLADASLFLMENHNAAGIGEIINIGTGTDLTIKELAELIKRIAGYTGNLEYDPSKPDGTPRKLLDVSRLRALGWKAKIGLEEGIAAVMRGFTQKHDV